MLFAPRRRCTRVRPRSLAILVVALVLGSAWPWRSTQAQPGGAEPLLGHAGSINAVLYSPDGDVIATAASDQLIRLWDSASRRELRTLAGHQGQVLCLAISPSGRTLISGAADNTLRQWDIPRREPLHSFPGHAAAVASVVLDPKSELAVTAGDDKSLRLWDLREQKIVAMWEGHAEPVRRLAYRADGAEVASGDAAGAILLWHTITGQPFAEIGAHGGEVTGLAYHPNNQQLFSAGADGLLQTWQLPIAAPRRLGEHPAGVTAIALTGDSQTAVIAAGELVQVIAIASGAQQRVLAGQAGSADSVAISPNNALAAAAGERGVVRLWNLADGADRGHLAGHAEPIHDIAFHPDNQRLATAGADGSLRLWQAPQPPLPLAGHTADGLAVAADPAGRYVVTSAADHGVRVFHPETGQPLRQLAGHQAPVAVLAASADGHQLASGDASGEIRLWKGDDGAPQARIGAHAGAITAAAYHPEGGLLATAATDGALKTWRLPLPESVPLVGHADVVSTVAIAGDASFVVAGGADRSLRMHHPDTGEVVRAFEGATAAVTSTALLGDDALLAAGAADGSLRFWRTADGAPWQGPDAAANAANAGAADSALVAPAALFGHTGAIRQIDHHAGSERLATVGADGTIRIWRLPTAPQQLAAAASPATRFVVSPDGRWGAIAGVLQERPAVFLHDLTTGRLARTLLGHAGEVTAIAFNDEGTLLATGGADQTARVWSLADSKFAEQHSLAQPAAVTAIAFHAESTQLLVATADNAIRQWSLADAAELRSMTGHGGAIRQLAVQGGTLFSAGADATVRSWNLETGAAIRAVSHGAAVHDIAVSSDGATIASAGADNNIKLWKGADGAPLATLAGHAGPVISLAFSDDDALLVSASAEGHRLWDVSSRHLLQAFPTGEWPVLGVGFGRLPPEAETTSDLSRHRLAVAGADGSLRAYSPDLLQWLVGHEGEVAGVQFHPAGDRLFSGGVDQTIREWRLADGSVTRTFAGPTDALTSLALTSDGAWLAAGSADQHVYLYNLASDAPAQNAPLAAVATLDFAAPVRSLQFSGDGGRLAIGVDNHTVHLWDRIHGRELQRFFGHTEAVVAVAISADGAMLASGSADKSARRWKVAAEFVHVDDDADVRALAFTPGGSALIAAGDQPRLTRWPVDAQQRLGEPQSIPVAAALPAGWSDAGKRRLAIHPTGEELAVLDVDGAVARWDLTNDVLLDALPPLPPQEDLAEPAAPAAKETSEPPPGDLAYSPAGEVLAIGVGRQVRFVDVASARQLEILDEPGAVAALALTPAGRLAIVRPGEANNAHLRVRSLLRWWLAHEGGAAAVAFTPDGGSLLSGGGDGLAKLWSLADASEVRRYVGATDAVTDVAMTPDGLRVIASSADRFVRVWPTSPLAPPAGEPASDAAEMAPTWAFEQPAAVQRISVSADNTRLLTAGQEPTVRLWDLALGRQVQRWRLHEESVAAAVLAADNRTIVTGGPDQTAQAASINVVRTIAAQAGPIHDLAVYNNGALAATAGDDALRVWTLATGQPAREFPAEGGFRALAVRNDSNQLVAADADNRLHLWSLATGEPVAQFALPAAVRRLQYSADNLKIVAAMHDGGLRFYSPADGALLYELASDQPLTAAVFTGDSRRVVTGGADGAVALWSYAAPEALRAFTGHGGNVNSVAYGPDGALIASASADQTIRLWDAATGAQRTQLTGHVGPVYSVAFSPDGALLVSCGADKSIRLWDVLGGRQLKQLPVGDETLYSVAFHPAGRRVAAAGAGKQVYVYDVVAGALQATLEGHGDYIYRVAYNQAGDRLLSVGYGGQVVVWNAANGAKLFENASGRVALFGDYAPDNDRIAIAGGDGRVHFIEIPSTAR